MIEHKSVQTSRLKTAYYHGGTNGKQKLMLIHGNCSSSVFYLKLMERLENDFEIVAPDLRCFGDSEALFVDATRGLRDWSDDIHELVCALHWESFIICGWSMGGGVAMQYAIDYSEYLDGIILEAPLSPFGFGGTYDKDGKKLMPSGLGSGGGCANVQLVKSLLDGDREFFRTLLKNSYVVQGCAIDAAWEEKLVDGIGSTKVGDGMYPGDFSETEAWPGVGAGTKGVCNTMAPDYCNLSALADIENKCKIAWIRGTGDLVVSDNSMCDFGQLGLLGIVPGWPGMESFPPQPMVSQMRYVLEKYADNGGVYQEFVLENSGHGCHIDNEEKFAQIIKTFF